MLKKLMKTGILVYSAMSMFKPSAQAQNKTDITNFHGFKAVGIEGKIIDFSQFKGKKLLVVNTASKCGLTPQYKELEALYQQYGGDNFEVIGFPANNFGNQEPGSEEQIAQFCERNYGVSFTMMSKVSVNGEDQHEIYQFLTSKELNGVEDNQVKWNFQKYLIDENGNYVNHLAPTTSPLDRQITDWISGN